MFHGDRSPQAQAGVVGSFISIESQYVRLRAMDAWDRTIKDYATQQKGFDSAETKLREVIEGIVGNRKGEPMKGAAPMLREHE